MNFEGSKRTFEIAGRECFVNTGPNDKEFEKSHSVSPNFPPKRMDQLDISRDTNESDFNLLGVQESNEFEFVMSKRKETSCNLVHLNELD
jgi:hypothetical protein